MANFFKTEVMKTTTFLLPKGLISVVGLLFFAISANAEYWFHTSSSSNWNYTSDANWTLNGTESKTMRLVTNYVGSANSGLDGDGNRQAIILNESITIRSLYWGDTSWKNPNPLSNYVAPTIRKNLPTGIIDTSKSHTITLDMSYTTPTTLGIYVYRGNADDVALSCNFLVTPSTNCHFDMYMSSDCNVTFSDGYTLTYTPAASTSYMRFYVYDGSSASASGNVYMNSKLVTNGAVRIYSALVDKVNNYRKGEIYFGGSESNVTNGHFQFYNDVVVHFNKTGGATAFTSNGTSNSLYVAGQDYSNNSKLYIHSDDQMVNARIVQYIHKTEGSLTKSGIILENGSSLNVGSINEYHLSTYFAITGNGTAKGKLLAYVDFGVNDVAQVFAANNVSYGGDIKTDGQYHVELAFYNFNEDDTFVLGRQISDLHKSLTKFYSDDGTTLISWDDIEESFYGNIDGKNYYAYTLIPEPSACAALLGMLALMFAAYRRKK